MTRLEKPAVDEGSPKNDVPNVRRRRRLAIEWVIILFIAFGASMILRTFVIQTFFIPSGSMEPTLWKGDRIIVDKLSVRFGTINIGDIIVFRAPSDVKTDCGDPVTDLVKRVVGLPGDHLVSKGNTIFVNGARLDQRWSVWPTLGATPIRTMTVPRGHYFVMGDNHANSCDSRTWGTVPRSSIIGKVFLKIWPLGSIHWY